MKSVGTYRLGLVCWGIALLATPFLYAHEEDPPDPGQDHPAQGENPCVEGFSSFYPCDEIDLLAVLPRAAMDSNPQTEIGNDIWGWTDPQNGMEYAIMGLSDGTAFVRLEDPSAPEYLGKLPSATVSISWRDFKVYQNHLYVVADGVGHGMQVFDLRKLRSVTSPQIFIEDEHYAGPGLTINGGFSLGNTHNIAINEESGFAYLVGTNTCGAGLHMIDLREPRNPQFAGCFGETGYTHDTQCVNYHGPDTSYQGQEICFNSDPPSSFDPAPSSLSIINVNDKSRPFIIAENFYPNSAYAHQGWLSEDHRFFFLGDELDEGHLTDTTATFIFDVSDLDFPVFIGTHQSDVAAIGHNMYVHEGRLYQANYTGGLRILDLDHLDHGEIHEMAFFDVYPDSDSPAFSGAWSVYPFFESGNVIISSIDGGLFVVRPHFAEGHNHEISDPDGPLEELGVPPRPPAFTARFFDSSVRLSWADASDLEIGYRIIRSVNGGPMRTLADLEANQIEYYDDATPGDILVYRVVALGAGETSAKSDRARVTVPGDPDVLPPYVPGGHPKPDPFDI